MSTKQQTALPTTRQVRAMSLRIERGGCARRGGPGEPSLCCMRPWQSAERDLQGRGRGSKIYSQKFPCFDVSSPVLVAAARPKLGRQRFPDCGAGHGGDHLEDDPLPQGRLWQGLEESKCFA